MSQVEFRVLGPLEAVVQGGPVPLGGRRARLVLAALLLDAGRVTTVDRLAEVVWQGSPPASVRTQVAICVSNLRRALGVAGHVIETVGRGYRVRADAVRLDACVAEDHIGRARKATSEGRPDEAVALLRAAVALWRGPVLDGLDSAVLADQALHWDLRLTAAEERAEAELALGAHPGVVADLTALVAAHPFRERLRALLMAALARSGRQADALAVYEDGRRVLAEELGLDPGRHLRTLHAAILRDDSSVYGSPFAVEPLTRTRPAQLPAAVSVFTGRRKELRALDDLLDGRRESDRHPPICVISGVAGVGKTGARLALGAPCRRWVRGRAVVRRPARIRRPGPAGARRGRSRTVPARAGRTGRTDPAHCRGARGPVPQHAGGAAGADRPRQRGLGGAGAAAAAGLGGVLCRRHRPAAAGGAGGG